MPFVEYVTKKFRAETEVVIDQANTILDEYAAEGFVITLRQLYYQFVARGLWPNTQKDYKRLASIVADARMAGRIDWDHIQDRTRNLVKRAHWSAPGGVIESAAASYGKNLWLGQDERVEVWIEKDALVGVIEDVCTEWDVPYFSCRGYASASEMWSAGRRLGGYAERGQRPTVIHLGDHDPSGIDMSRDIGERLTLFAETHVEVRRIALNRDQIDLYDPPPNPAKITDPRAEDYIAMHGEESWELDALNPATFRELIEEEVLLHLDRELWEEQHDEQEYDRELLQLAAERWDAVVAFLQEED